VTEWVKVFANELYEAKLPSEEGRKKVQGLKSFELFDMAATQNHQKAKDTLPVVLTLIKPQSSTNP
jgi:hypothetical protein